MLACLISSISHRNWARLYIVHVYLCVEFVHEIDYFKAQPSPSHGNGSNRSTPLYFQLRIFGCCCCSFIFPSIHKIYKRMSYFFHSNRICMYFFTSYLCHRPPSLFLVLFLSLCLSFNLFCN